MCDPVFNLDLRSVRVQTWSQVILQANSGLSQSKTMSGVFFFSLSRNKYMEQLLQDANLEKKQQRI